MNCNRCKLHKPYSEFYRDNRAKSGYRPTCKNCRYGKDAVDTLMDDINKKIKSKNLGKSDIKALINLSESIKHPLSNIIKINGTMIPSDDKINYIKSKISLYLAKKNIFSEKMTIEQDSDYDINNKIRVTLDESIKFSNKEIRKIIEYLICLSPKFNSLKVENIKSLSLFFEILENHINTQDLCVTKVNNSMEIVWSKNHALSQEDYQKLIIALSGV